jgi:hypothetical protein
LVGFVVIASASAGSKAPAVADKNQPQVVGTTNALTSQTPTVKTSYKIGEKIAINDFEFVVNSAELDAKSSNPYIKPTEGNKFVKLSISVQNTGKDKRTFSSFIDLYLKNDEGEKGTFGSLGDDKPLDGEILAGDKTKGDAVYQVSKTSKNLKLYYSPAFLPNQTPITITLE